MAAGSWGCGTGPKANRAFPPHMSVRNKAELGWATIVEVDPQGDAQFTFSPVQSGWFALRLPLGSGSAESFLVEYRPRVGFDTNLPAGGVLIYHEDMFVGPRIIPDTLPPAYSFHLVEADADNALRKVEAEGGNRGVPGDVFSADGSEVILTSFTAPSTRDHMGQATQLVQLAVQVTGSGARVTASYIPAFAVEPQTPAEGTVLSNFNATYQIMGGTGPVEVRAEDPDDLPAGLAVTVLETVLNVAGTPRQAGQFFVTVILTDFADRRLEFLLELSILDLQLDPLLLLEGLLDAGSDALSADVQEYLDLSGNKDGVFDLGDMRSALLRRGLISR